MIIMAADAAVASVPVEITEFESRLCQATMRNNYSSQFDVSVNFLNKQAEQSALDDDKTCKAYHTIEAIFFNTNDSHVAEKTAKYIIVQDPLPQCFSFCHLGNEQWKEFTKKLGNAEYENAVQYVSEHIFNDKKLKSVLSF